MSTGKISSRGRESLRRPPWSACGRSPPPASTAAIKLDDAPSVATDLLQLDFHSANEFDRTLGRDETDPATPLAFEVANDLLNRIRLLTRGGRVKQVRSADTYWRVEYLNDDGTELAADPTKFRRRTGSRAEWNLVGLTPGVWEDVVAEPFGRQPYVWDSLLLDAQALMPDVNPALALANAAIEVLAVWSTDTLAARSGLSAELWQWITERESWWQGPSVADRFDVLLKSLTGQSMKEARPDLWEAFKNLRAARISLAHQGTAMVGKNPVDKPMAMRLLSKASELVDWIEALLPLELRRPRHGGGATFTLEAQIIG